MEVAELAMLIAFGDARVGEQASGLLLLPAIAAYDLRRLLAGFSDARHRTISGATTEWAGVRDCHAYVFAAAVTLATRDVRKFKKESSGFGSR